MVRRPLEFYFDLTEQREGISVHSPGDVALKQLLFDI